MRIPLTGYAFLVLGLLTLLIGSNRSWQRVRNNPFPDEMSPSGSSSFEPAQNKLPAQAAKRYALLVGINEYENIKSLGFSRGNLSQADRDAINLGKTLLQGGYQENHVIIMTTNEPVATRFYPSLSNIRRELKSLCNALDESDSLIVAFSGYELQFAGSDEYDCCLADANGADKRSLLPLSELCTELSRAKAKCKVVIVDSCRGREGPGKEKAIRPKAPSDDVVLLFACSAGEEALEDPILKSGVFSHFLREGLRGAADEDHDRRVTWSELISYLGKQVPACVKARHKRSQNPEAMGRISDFAITLAK